MLNLRTFYRSAVFFVYLNAFRAMTVLLRRCIQNTVLRSLLAAISAEGSILNVSQRSEYAFAYLL